MQIQTIPEWAKKLPNPPNRLPLNYKHDSAGPLEFLLKNKPKKSSQKRKVAETKQISVVSA
jgi:hypothetical protein